MGASEKTVAEIGREYRIKRNSGSGKTLFTLEVFYAPNWYEHQKWNDPGHVANLLVKYGVAADHETAFEILKT